MNKIKKKQEMKNSRDGRELKAALTAPKGPLGISQCNTFTNFTQFKMS